MADITVNSGVTSSNISLNDQNMFVSSGGTAINTTANSKCRLNVSSGGIAINTTVNYWGCLDIWDSGSASGVTIKSGGLLGLYEYNGGGGVATDVTVSSGGKLFVLSGTTATKISLCPDGEMTVYSGGTAIFDFSPLEQPSFHTNQGAVVIYLGRDANVYYMNESSVISSANTMDNLIITTGKSATVYDGGTLNNVTMNGGCINVLSGGTAINTTNNRGGVYLNAGTMYKTTVNNRFWLEADGSANSTTVNSGGLMHVNMNCVADSTTVENGGVLSACYLGTLKNTIVNSGGSFRIGYGGTASNTMINGGSLIIGGPSGIATNTTVNSGGSVKVQSGGTAARVTVNSGGSVNVQSDGIMTGRMIFEMGAVVSVAEGGIVDFRLRDASSSFSALVNDLSLVTGTPDYTLTVEWNQSNGTYNLADCATGFNKTITVKNTNGAELGFIAVDTDTVAYGGKTFSLKLFNDTLSVIVMDATGSDKIFTGTVAYETKIISSGMSALGATISMDGVLNIQPDGNASNTTILDGGKLYATDASHLKGLIINQGGAAYIGSDTMAGNVVVNGGELHIESDGWADQTSKGRYVSSNTIVKNGGTVIVSGGGHCGGVIVSDGGHVIVESDGNFGAATVTSGDVTVKAGVESAGATLLDGGVMVIQSGGSGGCTVSSGGVVKVESGGFLKALTVNSGGVVTGVLHDIYTVFRMYGGTLDLDISNAAPGGEFLMDDDAFFDPNEDFNCTLTVNGSQAKGTYNLMENAYDFDTKVLIAENPLTVKNTSGEALGTLTVGQTASINGANYTLNLSNDNHLTVTISGSTPPPPTPTGRAKSDIDGNGISDVMFVWTGEHGEGNYQHGYWMNGTNEWQSANSNHPAEWDNLGCYDMTGDGKADSVLFGNVTSEAGIHGAYIGYYADANDLPDGSTWVNIGYLNNVDNIDWKNKIGNLTGNKSGVNSIVWYAPELYALGVWTDGTENWVELSKNFGGEAWTLVGCGDFSGDGKDSVLMALNGGEQYYVVGIDGVASALATSDNGWEVRAIGDFSGDGRDDIVAFHAETGLVFMWADGNAANWSQLGQLDAKDWFVVGAGDYNADGNDDLLVRQKSTGMLGYYSSGSMSNWVELGRGVDMQWTVIA